MKAIPNYLGNQSASDNKFAKKCRLLQSWYRYNILKEECGYGPTKSSSVTYGNMLKDGILTGSNFLTPETFEYAKHRKNTELLGETIEEYRLFNNMLGSQPMCFNLFYPLKRHFERDYLSATRVIASCFPILSISKVLGIEIEYFPYPQDEYLNDRTAFDAIILFNNNDGKRCVLAVETKYVEKLGSNVSSNKQQQIELVRSSKRFNERGNSSAQTGYSQIGRNYLLALKYAEVNNFSEVYAVVLSPRENSSVPEIEQFKENLNDNYKDTIFQCWLEDYVTTLKETVPISLHSWVAEFEKRYLDFTPIQEFL